MGRRSLALPTAGLRACCWPPSSAPHPAAPGPVAELVAALETGVARRSGELGHSVRAVFLGRAAHHHRAGLHPERHGAAVWRAGGVAWLGDRINRLRWLAWALVGAWRCWFGGRRGAGIVSRGALGHLPPGGHHPRHRGQLRPQVPDGVPPLATATGSQLGRRWALCGPCCGSGRPPCRGAGLGRHCGYIAVLCTGIAYILYFRLIAHAGPSRALAVTFMAPVLPFSTVWCSSTRPSHPGCWAAPW